MFSSPCVATCFEWPPCGWVIVTVLALVEEREFSTLSLQVGLGASWSPTARGIPFRIREAKFPVTSSWDCSAGFGWIYVLFTGWSVRKSTVHSLDCSESPSHFILAYDVLMLLSAINAPLPTPNSLYWGFFLYFLTQNNSRR